MSQRTRVAILVASTLTTAALMPLMMSAPQTPSPELAAETPRTVAADRLAPPAPSLADPTLHSLDVREGDVRPAYVEDQLLVSVRGGADLDAIARDLDLGVAQPVGPSGYGAVRLPTGVDRDAVQERLNADPRVGAAGPMGQLYAAGKGGTKGKKATTSGAETTTASADTRSSDEAFAAAAPNFRSLQWHLDAIYLPDEIPEHQDRVIVAILDTGLAYTRQLQIDAGPTQVASSLANNPIVAPYDFVNDDAIPLDDHQHGTHMASLIASNGVVMGVAPGAALMPIKVLDANKRGTELDLLDGLAHAVDNGADVINLSLAFSADYVPSGALMQALDEAAASGAILVGATGNNADRTVSWPAASPAVLAVGATSNDDAATAWYSNASYAVDLVAPGGSMDVDMDGDGYPDGLLAETIDFKDPSSTGLYFAEGTSQAAAVVSGAAARLLALGAPPEHLAYTLRWSTSRRLDGIEGGRGNGQLDVFRAEDEISRPDELGAPSVHVAMHPYLQRLSDGSVRPAADLYAIQADGTPRKKITLWARFGGTAASVDSCAARDGRCTVYGASTTHDDALFTINIEAATDNFLPLGTPTTTFFASDALEVLATALADHPNADGALPAFHVAEGTDPDIGKVAEHYMAMNDGTGLLSSPMGVVFRPSVLSSRATVSNLSLDLDGTGLLSSPMGFQPAQLITFKHRNLSLITLDGTGLLSSPMGFTARSMYYPWSAPSVTLVDPVFTGQPVMLGASTSAFAGTAIGDVLDDGGFLSADGAPAATEIVGAGLGSAAAGPATDGLQAPIKLTP